MTAVSSTTLTGNTYIDSLLSGTKWAVTSLTYSFPTSLSQYSYSEPNFKAFTSTQIPWVDLALQNYGSVINMGFTKVIESSTVSGTLRYAESDDPATAYGYYPSSSEIGGDMWFNNSNHYYDNPKLGSYAYEIILHETGHAMGLKHPHEGSPTMPTDKDSVEYTVMSYHSYVGSGTSAYTIGSTSYPTTLMMLDIQALQYLYGANYTTNSTDTIYSWSPTTGQESINGAAQTMPAGNKIFMTIWDGGGSDTYDLSSYTTSVSINLNPGAWSVTSATQLGNLGNSHYAVGNIANSLLYKGFTPNLIENAVGGSAGDKIVGNQADNVLTGNGGNDVIDGGAGVDTALYHDVSANYTWAMNADGSWTVSSALEGVDTLTNVENLQFTDLVVAIGTATPFVPVDPTTDPVVTPPPPTNNGKGKGHNKPGLQSGDDSDSFDFSDMVNGSDDSLIIDNHEDDSAQPIDFPVIEDAAPPPAIIDVHTNALQHFFFHHHGFI